MPFTTYTELKAAVESRTKRGDVSALVADWITIAEKRLNRELQLTEEELETTLTATVSSRQISLPSDFGTPIALYLTTYLPRSEIPFLLPDQMQVYNSTGPAQFWTIDGSYLKTDTPADLAYTYSLRYASEFNIASTSTNSLLTQFPDAYLYGALIEAGSETKNPQLRADSESRYMQALEEAKNYINKRRSIAKLRTDINFGQRSNILLGE